MFQRASACRWRDQVADTPRQFAAPAIIPGTQR